MDDPLHPHMTQVMCGYKGSIMTQGSCVGVQWVYHIIKGSCVGTIGKSYHPGIMCGKVGQSYDPGVMCGCSGSMI